MRIYAKKTVNNTPLFLCLTVEQLKVLHGVFELARRRILMFLLQSDLVLHVVVVVVPHR